MTNTNTRSGNDLIPVVVVAKRDEAEDICSFEFSAAGQAALPPAAAGDHIDVHLPDGLIRQYSLINGPQDYERYRIAVLRQARGRGGSVAMHSIPQGAELKVSLPRTNFPLEPSSDVTLLIAGGIGITPMLSMAEHLFEGGHRFELYYLARSRARAAFVKHLADRPYASRVHCFFDDSGERLDIERLIAKNPGGRVYVCGPEGLMDAVRVTGRQLGLPEEAVRIERFGPAPALGEPQGTSFEVLVNSTGQTLQVSPDERVCDVLARAGIEVPLSCEAGVCGTCLVGVLEGVPDHRDEYLTAKEKAANRSFTPCCSRSLSPRLVLDL